jgi:A/G-specific adenine glycosylase
MLQQTQVSRVISKFHEFKAAFPTLNDLAQADTKKLLQVWSGLGYNRRALWLREAAQQIVALGEFPCTVEDLRKLKGIGPYTSRSILIFAFNQDIAAVETNIRRVLIANEFAEEDMSEKQLQQIADQLLLKERSSDWHNALMDYGAMVQTARTTGIAPTSSQPKFTGSARQLRGAIVRIVSCTDFISYKDLTSKLQSEGIYLSDTDTIINQLIAEGFLEQTEDSNLRIAEC